MWANIRLIKVLTSSETRTRAVQHCSRTHYPLNHRRRALGEEHPFATYPRTLYIGISVPACSRLPGRLCRWSCTLLMLMLWLYGWWSSLCFTAALCKKKEGSISCTYVSFSRRACGSRSHNVCPQYIAGLRSPNGTKLLPSTQSVYASHFFSSAAYQLSNLTRFFFSPAFNAKFTSQFLQLVTQYSFFLQTHTISSAT